MTDNPNYQRIWLVTQCIPAGKVACYGQIADLAGLPGRARLVGKALQNIPEQGYKQQTVPWHRVVRSDGRIAFPVGSEPFETQRQLLLVEGIQINGSRINIKQFGWQPELGELLFDLSF